MDIAVIRLTATDAAAHRDLSPEVVTDIIWAAATPADGLEHVRARAGPTPGSIDLVLFRRRAPSEFPLPGIHVCRRAVTTSPRLVGWTAAPADVSEPDPSAQDLSKPSLSAPSHSTPNTEEN